MFKSTLILLTLFMFSFSNLASEAENQSHRIIKQQDLVYLELDTGLVLIELAPFIAPNYVEQFKGLVQGKYYDGLDFYRVIDGFVAQAGDMEETRKHKWNKEIKAELTRPITKESNFISVQQPAFFAEQEGYINGFQAARDSKSQQEWLLHCYGSVALARSTQVDTGSSHFYIVIGHAPRRLDKNLTVFGRVVYGMDKIQKIQRPEFGSAGIIEDATNRTKIISARLGSDIAPTDQINLQQLKVSSDDFQQRLKGARSLDNEFYHDKGAGVVDVCSYPPAIKLSNTNLTK